MNYKAKHDFRKSGERAVGKKKKPTSRDELKRKKTKRGGRGVGKKRGG